MARTILLPGTLDTKAEEYRYVAERIGDAGHRVVLMDLGVLGDPPSTPDISADEVARAGGASLSALREGGDRGEAMRVMRDGARTLVPDLHARGAFDGILGLGGGGGTSVISAAMQTLPVGVPKVMVSTMASGDTRPYVDVKDVTMVYPVVDIAGLNPISRSVLANAAGAICGMVETEAPPRDADRPLLAATMFGVTTPCVTRVRERLEEWGYDVAVFHATGSGGRAMEGLVRDGFISGVVDVTTTEWCDEVVGGVLSAGPDRLSAAGEMGLPQVVSVGALDMVNFGPPETVPEEHRGRTFHHHNPTVTLMRTTAEECGEIGRRIASQLNAARGPTVLVLPLRGVSMLDREGEPFHDPEADEALFRTLRTELGSHVRVVEVDAHMNDPEFADALTGEAAALMSERRGAERGARSGNESGAERGG